MRRWLLLGSAAVVGIVAVGTWWLLRDSPPSNIATAPPSTLIVQRAGCEHRVIVDVQKDGRVDRIYPAACYRRAIRLIPEDSPVRAEVVRALAFAHPRKPKSS
jgi:hypothetical protein